MKRGGQQTGRYNRRSARYSQLRKKALRQLVDCTSKVRFCLVRLHDMDQQER
jgi:hypothetical protein